MDAAKKYEYIKTLGEGSYGHVWLCRDRERDCLVAIKKFKDANKDSQAYHLAMREIKLLRATSHEHVVSVIEAFRSQSSGNVYLVMEYAESCLNLELKKHRTGLPTADVMRITWQLASALQYLHSRKIVHRDLKPANILLTAAGDLKLCDFGFARDLPPAGQQADMSSYVTTRWYRAPEVVVGAEYGAAVDIWALGCLFAELLNGQPLFPGASNMDQLALIVACFGHLPNRLLAKALTNPQLVGVQLRTGNPRNWAVALQQRFAPYGENAVTLLLSCLNPDPLKRATADEVLRAPYFEPIRQKKVPSLNGPPTIAITVTTAAPPTSSSAPLAAPAAASAGPVHPAAAVPPAAAAAAATAAADASNSTTAAAAASKAGKEAAQPQPQQQQQQDPLAAQPQPQPQLQAHTAMATPSTEGVRRTSKEAEPQPERPALAVTVQAVQAAAPYSAGNAAATAAEAAGPAPVPAPASAATGAGGSGASEPQAVKSGPMHPAIVMVPRQAAAAEASAREAEQEAGSGSGSGSRTTDMEVGTPPAAPAQPSAGQPQRQTSQVRFLPPTLPSFGHGSQSQGQLQVHGQGEQHAFGASGTRPGLSQQQQQQQQPSGSAGVAAQDAASGAVEAARQLQQQQQMQQQQQQRDLRAPPSFQQMRVSMAAIPMSSSMGARPLTDTGIGVPNMIQMPLQAAQGKAGATLVQHTKRASEHSIGMYGTHRGPGGAGGPSDLPMRLARVSLVNPNIDVSQLAPENTSASSSPSTTPTGAAAAAAASGGAANPSNISPAGSLMAGGAPALANGLAGGSSAPYAAAASGRRRSTATGSRLTRVSNTNEGQDPQQRDDDSEDDRSSERLESLPGSHAVNAPGHLGIMVGTGLHSSPRRRHSRLASVTEPGGGQYPPGGGGAAPAAAAAMAISSSATDGSSLEHLSGASSRGLSAAQMLSPLGRSAHHLNHHGANVISAGPSAIAGPTQGAALIMSDTGHGHGGGAVHGPLHATMSAMALNMLGIGGAAAAGGRDRDRDREGHAEAGGTLRSNAMVGIATPAAPTASQRSFTSQSVSTSAAAAGLMSRPVSNLYINLEHHMASISSTNGGRVAPYEAVESTSADSSAAISPSTPTGGGSGGGAAPTAAAAAAAAPVVSRRTTFTDGPGSMFKSVLRTLSTRRSTTISNSGMVVDHQPSAAVAAASVSAAAAAAQPPVLQPTNSVGGAPPAPSYGSLSISCGAAHSQSSASSGGVSPFIPSRASSHNFITGGPPERVPVEVASSLSVPGGSDDYSAAAAALRRSVPVTHGVVGAGGGAVGARIGLPHLNVRVPEAAAGGGPVTIANGYGSAVVSPAGRRRSQLAAQPARTSDAGMVVGSTAIRQTSSGSVGMSMPAGHQGCKPAPSLHGEMVGVPGLVVGGAAGLPVVRNPTLPGEGPSAGRMTSGKGSRDVA